MACYLYRKNFNILSVSGKDCISFLQGQCTNDLRALGIETPIQMNAFCNRKGRVISLFYARFISNEHLLLALPKSLFNIVIKTLRKYVLLSKVFFEENYDKYQLVYDNGKYKNDNLISRHKIIRVHEKELVSSMTFEEVQKDHVCQKIPMINIENTGLFLPAELQLDNLGIVSYKKGCFVGQEIIARMKYQSILKKYLIAIKTERTLPLGKKLRNIHGKNIADIVNQINTKFESYILCVFYREIIQKELPLLEGNLYARIIN